jgi:beta-N-acetylhexosaminidase
MRLRLCAVLTVLSGMAVVPLLIVRSAAHGITSEALAARSISAAPPNAAAEARWIRGTIARMSLREEVGQLFEINGYGQSLRDPNPAMVALNREFYGVDNLAQLIAKYHPGGIIYFTWADNLMSPTQIATLSNEIQGAALREHGQAPMVISTDQEEGEVLRIGPPATVFPGNMPLGATRSTALAYRAARVTGQELRAMGINVDNAPVVDVNIDPLNQADGIRAYGDSVPLVAKLGVAQVRGYQQAQSTTGVGATAKHWPGFGDSEVNSDNGVATSPETLTQVKRVNMPSFRAALKAGIDRIMVTHILFTKVTGSRVPSSLSPFWVSRMLRGYLHYDGPVVTDALDATALNGFSAAHVALAALRAGDDQLLEIAQTPADKPPADLVSAYDAVLNAVRKGTISKARLDRSVSRILELKWKLGLVRNPFTRVRSVPRVVGISPHLAVAKRVAAGSITLLKNSSSLLPLAAQTGKRVLVTGVGQVPTSVIAQDVHGHGLSADALPTGGTPTQQAIAQAVQAAARHDIVIVTTFNAWGSPAQVQLVNALLGTGKPVIAAAIGTPYDVAYFPSAPTVITSYGYQPVSLHALVAVLFGQLSPTGKLPVTIREPSPSTRVLYPFGFNLSLP